MGFQEGIDPILAYQKYDHWVHLSALAPVLRRFLPGALQGGCPTDAPSLRVAFSNERRCGAGGSSEVGVVKMPRVTLLRKRLSADSRGFSHEPVLAGSGQFCARPGAMCLPPQAHPVITCHKMLQIV